MSTTAPGWYPDPYGQAQLRYWDGSLWTGHVSGAPGRPAPAQPAAAQAPVAAQVPTAPQGPVLAQAPAAGQAATPQGPQFTRGFSGSRMRNTRTLAIFLGAFAVVVIGGALAVALLGRGDPERSCPADRVCSDPPQGEPLVNLSLWRSEELGYQFEYDDEEWEVVEEEADRAVLQHRVLDARIIVAGAPSTQATAEQAFGALRDDIGANLVGLTEDTDPVDQLYGASIGYVDGVGESYSGGIDTPQGVVEVSLVVMSATEADVTASAAVLTAETRGDEAGGPDRKDATYSRADSILNTFDFSPEAGGS